MRVRNKSVKLYHGSPHGFAKIIPTIGSPKNDFGLGWYGATRKKYAEDRGELQAKKINAPMYYLYQYEFDDDEANDDGISYRRFVDDEAWAEFVLENAIGENPENPYDITSGPYCDMAARKKSVEAYRRMKSRGEVDFGTMIEIMEPNMDDIQYTFHTPRATKYLKYPKRYIR